MQLRSTDPRDVPDIRFRYFDEGTNDAGQASSDLEAVTAGVRTSARSPGPPRTCCSWTSRRSCPDHRSRSHAQIADFVKKEAWGHHASCTCRIGADDDPMAVLDSKFRVRGTTGLRVVDASVFPAIPGFFIVAPIYMISEKASAEILAEAR